MSRCYCNQCENGGYFEPDYDSAEVSAEFAPDVKEPFDDVEEPFELDPNFVGPSNLMVVEGDCNDFIPF